MLTQYNGCIMNVTSTDIHVGPIKALVTRRTCSHVLISLNHMHKVNSMDTTLTLAENSGQILSTQDKVYRLVTNARSKRGTVKKDKRCVEEDQIRQGTHLSN